MRGDMSRMRGRMPSILVATPGRLLDLLSQEGFDMKGALSALQLLVLDEADTLLDMGFRCVCVCECVRGRQREM